MKHKGQIKYLSIGIFQYRKPCYNGPVFMEKVPEGFCTIEAPCKINLHLSIGERRPDGFHSLESIFASLALGDTLRFKCTKKGDSHLFMNWDMPGEFIPERPISPEKNLVLRAVSLFRQQTGFKNGLDIRLDKRIPAGSGLGGGSSDAASTLLALNLLAGTMLPMEKLMEMAALLGSDVPFFLTGGAAFVSGRGERVEAVKAPKGLWVVLSKPPISIDTASAFRLLDQARESRTGGGYAIGEEKSKGSLKKALSKKALSKKGLIQALGEDPGIWPFCNDFQSLFDPIPVLEDLRKTGASFSGLSGSGSCCFGVFKSKGAAEKAVKELSGPENYVKLTFFLAQKAKPIVEY